MWQVFGHVVHGPGPSSPPWSRTRRLSPPALPPPGPPIKPPSALPQSAAAPLNPARPRPHPSVFSPFYFFMNEKRSGRSQANLGAPIGRLRPRPLSRSQWCSAERRAGGRGATPQPIRGRERQSGGLPLASAEGKQAARGGAAEAAGSGAAGRRTVAARCPGSERRRAIPGPAPGLPRCR